MAAATANAIYNATGVQIHRLPLTPENVYRALHGQSTPPTMEP
jgi:CO/xanthine dehydrogenase Mo-binding subunit